MKIWLRMKLWQQVFIGLVAGVAVGAIFGEKASYIKPLGDIFIRLIQMIIVPLIFFSLVTGLTGATDRSALSRVAIKSTIAFLITTSLAITIGMIAAILFEPGIGIFSASLHTGDFVLPTGVERSLSISSVIQDTMVDASR